ncbi:hypothetical protein [Cellulomonas shaoxiangyii]|uniref:YbaB/EbfC family DNA-binding protein n=1 Tax=Cellulomonas shaoxiangyii TaxID=2566013 RepID=A0A4P7SG10_9CELL|nr:hypothetical protein [Cellulomonas shaoxiangyii]QCB92518.1 hypothetical protein E5225_02045 [Cellulomonas shaoxiangyii]TGY83391.1 hypothetical protein E5226_12215 [Cellulomonas shaoxiangyii]
MSAAEQHVGAAEQAEPVLARVDALVARGRALEERTRAVEREIAEMLPDTATDLATATCDEHGVLTALAFAPAAAEATPQQVEDAVNVAIGRAAGTAGVLGDALAAAVLGALAGGTMPRPTEHVALGGAIRVEAFLGRPGRVHLRPDLVERTALTAVAEAVVAAHAAAARESAPVPPAPEV